MSRANSRRRGLLISALAIAFAGPIASRPALAQVGDLPATQTALPGSPSGVDVAGKLPYWKAGETRPFVAATFDAGVIFYRTIVAVGYGKPHWSWIGAEGYSLISPNGGSFYAGLRGTLPRFEARDRRPEHVHDGRIRAPPAGELYAHRHRL
jgi:hypothetical protein